MRELFTRLARIRLLVGAVGHDGLLNKHRREHDFLFHRADLLVQVDDVVHVLLNLQVHVGRVVLLRVVLEHHHAVLLIDGGEDFTRFDLKREKSFKTCR